jgi:hypothetical protein
MKIIRRKSDNIVLFAEENLTLNPLGVHGDGWEYTDIDWTTVELITVITLPEHFVPSGWTYIDGIWASNEVTEEIVLPVLLAQKIAELKNTYAAITYSPIEYLTKFYSTDPANRSLLSEVLSVGSVPENMYWIDADGTENPMTYSDLQGLGRAILDRGLIAHQNLVAKTAAANAATSIEELNAITW